MFNIFENNRKRQRQRTSRGGTEKERERRHRIWSKLQALSCQHGARCGAQTHDLWDHDLSQSWTLNWLSHPDTPLFLIDRERQSTSGGGAEREEDRIRSRLQALSCQHRAWCGVRTHEWWDSDLSPSQTLTRWSEPPRHSHKFVPLNALTK